MLHAASVYVIIIPIYCVLGNSDRPQLEWVRQLSQDQKNFIVAVVRNPARADLLKPLLGSGVVVVQGDVEDIDSFPVPFEFRFSLRSY